MKETNALLYQERKGTYQLENKMPYDNEHIEVF